VRDRLLQEFSNAAWQRHVKHGASREGLQQTWPNREVFRSWSGVSEIAFLLIVADWKVVCAAAHLETGEPLLRRWTLVSGKLLEIASEIDPALLDPPPPPDHDWREVYAAELATRPEILRDLASDKDRLGDGIELVLERAQLSSGERAVMRPRLSGDDLATIASDLNWRPQTVGTLLRNAEDRLQYLGQHPEAPKERGNVFSRDGHADRARASHVSSPAGSRQRDHTLSRAG